MSSGVNLAAAFGAVFLAGMLWAAGLWWWSLACIAYAVANVAVDRNDRG